MDIKTINNNEWNNPGNWSRRGIFGIYFSKTDTRAWVPKALPALGWTINFGHPNSVFWLGAVIILPVLLVVGLTQWLAAG